ncbi:outer membrane protein OmpA-like peptidoglycan-associated protein [Sphingomonas kaistensis]|uniref:Outer membrane protein OmpA-like peptidoglycan-associated protein n=1 Tax=Sphingomonas kaistensis TaxID=298708 RepID=A0A7X5Y782_9SPHN|nr:OmpA family protein [Sphingomonas kaistensis]NJC06018.1 outer membrane protein OmpA-like peptidoglycan-associated protein [Sphingomonas kaistensis]
MPARPSFRIALVSATLVLAGCGGSNPFSGDPAPLDVQIAHPNGVVLQLLSAGASGDHVVVNARVLNGRDQEVKLAQGTEKSYLLTGSGEKLFLVPPAANESLAIPAGQVMDVALVFAGKLPGDGKATLVLSENGNADSVYTGSPRFQVVLAAAPGGGSVPEMTALSNMRPLPTSTLQASAGTGSSLGSGGQATSELRTVEALKSELGAQQTERGTVVSLASDVTFDFDKATLRDNAKPTLDRLAELIKASPAGAISIEGHTDAKGDDDYNKRLSEQRAAAVKEYLATKGIDAAKLTTIALGELRPVAPNAAADGGDDEAGRQRNRRVEVILPKS